MISEIQELSLLADIEAISQEFAREFGAPLVNVSRWDPAQDVVGDMKVVLQAAPDVSLVDYSFSYELPERPRLVSSFGFDANHAGCLVTHSGSTAIVAGAHWLRSTDRSRVLLIGPRYFSVPHALHAFGLTTDIVHLIRTPEGYSLPELGADLLGKVDAIWITNPVYCASVDLSDADKNRLKHFALQHRLAIVVDECLAESGRFIAADLANVSSCVALYSPHKTICVNGIKFGAVIFPGSHQQFFDTWSDVWNGCLPVSSVLAVRHYLSDDFARYQRAFKQKTRAGHAFVRALVAQQGNLSIDANADGYLVSIFAPAIDWTLGTNLEFLREAAWTSGTTFISGQRNELDPSAGLSFRVNLAALDIKTRGALARLCVWLNGQAGRGS